MPAETTMTIRQMADEIEKLKRMRRALNRRPIRVRRRGRFRHVELDLLCFELHLALGDLTDLEVAMAERLLPGVVARLTAQQGEPS